MEAVPVTEEKHRASDGHDDSHGDTGPMPLISMPRVLQRYGEQDGTEVDEEQQDACALARVRGMNRAPRHWNRPH